MKQFRKSRAILGKSNLLEVSAAGGARDPFCAVLGPDGKWDEDNLCELPERAITLLREPAEAAVPAAVGI